MADYAKFNDVAVADIVKINGTAKSAIEKIDGCATPSSGATLWVMVVAALTPVPVKIISQLRTVKMGLVMPCGSRLTTLLTAK